MKDAKPNRRQLAHMRITAAWLALDALTDAATLGSVWSVVPSTMSEAGSTLQRGPPSTLQRQFAARSALAPARCSEAHSTAHRQFLSYSPLEHFIVRLSHP